MSLLPAFLDLRGARTVVVGGGPVALRRTRTLLGSGAQVQVIAPDLHPDLAALPVQVQRRPYRPGDLNGAALAVAATSLADVNGQVVGDARALGIPVNDASDATRGTLRFAATAAQAGVQVAVSSGRELPMFSQALAERITALLPSETQLDDWSARREAALTCPEPQRSSALGTLRDEIRRAMGVGA
ncbi:bifunctional precorrin-2 dehydrogenase/sirohydrochlorin ferrochelatase [Deinococcus depolymerans]|uniref:precorrin-2 dehydrogenase/sirohydrochlorin ferrochelatase family protein n=1 Tax=Deinococcus depolymerans TaxID=392408 RepID=UPI0031E3C8B5